MGGVRDLRLVLCILWAFLSKAEFCTQSGTSADRQLKGNISNVTKLNLATNLFTKHPSSFRQVQSVFFKFHTLVNRLPPLFGIFFANSFCIGGFFFFFVVTLICQ